MIPRNPPTETTSRRRWLLVDDNEEILFLMQETVAQIFGVEATACLSPWDALAAFRAAPDEFQCVITDLEMPLMDGVELCRRLHAISPGITVLLATGSHYVTAEEARLRGFSGLLTKPFSPFTLHREIFLAGCLTGQPIPILQVETGCVCV